MSANTSLSTRAQVRIPRLLLLLCSLAIAAGHSAARAASAPGAFPIEADIAAVQRALRGGETTCVALTRFYLSRIEALDKPAGLNAIISINPQALARARALDAALAGGERVGPLFCVPVLVKDNYNTTDMPTSGGNLALAESRPQRDATVVARLRAAGVVLLARSNMDEFAFRPGSTVSSLLGATRNAYDRNRTAAGSSGGSAVGVTANFALIGLASDTGNSIRGPAAHASLVGLRATMGLISRSGVMPLIADRDMSGVLTRSVADTARVLSVIAGPDPADPITALAAAHTPQDYHRQLDADSLRGARLGVFSSKLGDDTHPAVRALFTAAVGQLRSAGATVVESVTIEDYDVLLDQAESCFSFRHDLNRYLAELGESAPLRTLAEIVDSGRYSAAHSDALQRALAVQGSPAEQTPPCRGHPGDIANNPGRQALREALVATMDAAQLDALIYPSWRRPPQILGSLDALPDNLGDNSQRPAPQAGLPALSVPMGFDADGLPHGLQLLGRPFSEARLLALAYAFEQRTQHRRPPALPASPPPGATHNAP